jgi:hypothetical protein
MHDHIDGMKLVDFKVRILNTGTEAVTRVTIESASTNDDAAIAGAPLASMPISSWHLLKR